jgi:hypothetical protein
VTITSALPGVKVAIDGARAGRAAAGQGARGSARTPWSRPAPGYAERTLPVATVDGALVPVEIELDALPARGHAGARGGARRSRSTGAPTTGDVRRGVAVPGRAPTW